MWIHYGRECRLVEVCMTFKLATDFCTVLRHLVTDYRKGGESIDGHNWECCKI